MSFVLQEALRWSFIILFAVLGIAWYGFIWNDSRDEGWWFKWFIRVFFLGFGSTLISIGIYATLTLD